MAWLYIFIASVLEVGWAIGLKLSTTLPHWLGTAVLIVGSFIFLILAANKMKPSYAYVFFVVFGTVGTFLFDILFMGKSVNIISIIAIIVIIIGVVRLKQIGE
ncbi:quaternary ammonium compound-resistance protein SugE [Acinetobacter cumulans]|uniref:Guanidinium exporter n=1 Tax=Acinetobacter cumulans TaxID=2136182 RepID=A0A498CZV5_9GAMM|nr:SMR family transporter [Acinetobacter cumulans]RLL34816.1 quaternary ammonium compound-resistance protein SugE [Acinetobacter cumulans]